MFSLGLRRSTLRHRMLASKQMWLTQVCTVAFFRFPIPFFQKRFFIHSTTVLKVKESSVKQLTVVYKKLHSLQVRDFFDVKDDPVLGFSPPAVVTVFHTHVWEGTIDYR